MGIERNFKPRLDSDNSFVVLFDVYPPPIFDVHLDSYKRYVVITLTHQSHDLSIMYSKIYDCILILDLTDVRYYLLVHFL